MTAAINKYDFTILSKTYSLPDQVSDIIYGKAFAVRLCILKSGKYFILKQIILSKYYQIKFSAGLIKSSGFFWFLSIAKSQLFNSKIFSPYICTFLHHFL